MIRSGTSHVSSIAIALIHGIGRTEPGYSPPSSAPSRAASPVSSGRESPDAARELVFEEVNWSAALQLREDRLWRRLLPDGPMRYKRLPDSL